MKTNLQDEETIEVAMAPLIDCVFLLLIFFLVATTLKKIDNEVPLTLPAAQTSVEVQQPDVYLVISIDRNGEFYIDGTPVGISVLQQSIRDRAREDRDVKVRVDVHASIPFQQVMQVLDLLRFEQLHNIGLNSREAKVRAK